MMWIGLGLFWLIGFDVPLKRMFAVLLFVPDLHKEFARLVLTGAVAYASEGVMPSVMFDDGALPRCRQFVADIGVVGELGLQYSVHDVYFNIVPVVALRSIVV